MSETKRQTRTRDVLDAYQAGLAMAGDKAAFEALYRRWHPQGLRLAQRLLRNGDEARDVMQDTALTIARDIRKLRDPARFSAWAYTVVRRRAADHIDRNVRRRQAEADLPEREPAPARDMSLRQALSELPETDRLMLELFYIDGFRGREIAEALGLPLGTIKSRLFRAREILKDHYTKGDVT